MKVGLVRVSYEYLEHVLRLPVGMRIHHVFEDGSLQSTVVLKVVGPMCPEVADGQLIPWIEIEVKA